MKWFEIELEINIFGKDFQTIQAPDIETAKEIVKNIIISRYKIKSHHFQIIKIKEIIL